MKASSAAPLTNLQAFTPKPVTVLRDGYSSRLLWADGVAALIGTSAVVPVILALTITAGVSPDRGMISAGVALCIVAIFGGSSFQTCALTSLAVFSRISNAGRAQILNAQRVTCLDGTGTEALKDLLHRCQRQRTILVLAHPAPAVRAHLSECGLLSGHRLVIANHVSHALQIVDALTGGSLDGERG